MEDIIQVKNDLMADSDKIGIDIIYEQNDDGGISIVIPADNCQLNFRTNKR